MSSSSLMFRYDLAAHLGMTVKRLGTELDSVELSHWEARDLIKPLDTTRRLELSGGIIAAQVYNSTCTKSHQLKAAKDFIPDYEARYRASNVEEIVEPPSDLSSKIDDVMKLLGG